MFRDEAGALLSLPHHENLARFVTFDLAARPKPILVMELIRGAGLDRLIHSKSLTTDLAFEYLDGPVSRIAGKGTPLRRRTAGARSLKGTQVRAGQGCARRKGLSWQT